MNRVAQRYREFEAESLISLMAVDRQGQVVDPEKSISQFLLNEADRALFVVGVPGIGKTTLISQWVSELALDALATFRAGDAYPQTIIPVW